MVSRGALLHTRVPCARPILRPCAGAQLACQIHHSQGPLSTDPHSLSFPWGPPHNTHSPSNNINGALQSKPGEVSDYSPWISQVPGNHRLALDTCKQVPERFTTVRGIFSAQCTEKASRALLLNLKVIAF